MVNLEIETKHLERTIYRKEEQIELTVTYGDIFSQTLPIDTKANELAKVKDEMIEFVMARLLKDLEERKDLK